MNNLYDVNSDELLHYGRKGMKWGQHIFGKVKTAAANRKMRKEEKKAAEVVRKRASITNHKKLTNEELEQRIKRMRLEKDYLDLMKETTPEYATKEKGKNFVTKILETSGTSLLTQVANHYGSVGLNKLIGSEVIFANNKKKS